MTDQIQRGSRRNFFIVDNGIFDKRLDLEPLDKLVYICLLRYADNNSREAFPGQERIANDIGIKRNRVIKAIKVLNEKGLIEVKKRFDKTGSQKSNLYIVYDANAVINRVYSENTGGVSQEYRGCLSQRHEGVSQEYTNYTDLKILSEKEIFHLNDKDQILALSKISELKKLIQDDNNNGSKDNNRDDN